MNYHYFIAFLSLINGFFAIFTLIEKIPATWLYYHYHIRKPLAWIFCFGSFGTVFLNHFQQISAPLTVGTILSLLLVSLSVILVYKLHQENWFKAVDFPEMTHEVNSLPIQENCQLAVIEVDGIIKAYPLDYVVHHHIINDRFGKKIISLTYCAMCRSIIPFDVTDMGPLFVGSFKNANMIVADKKTKTFFQQATFQSIIGKLHPYQLKMIPFQILSWKDIKRLNPLPLIAVVTDNDFRPFSLPMPGVWKKVMSTELTPGLSSKDTTFPSKTRVIGIIDSTIQYQVVYIKKEITKLSIIKNEELGFSLIHTNDTVNGFRHTIGHHHFEFSLNKKQCIVDKNTGTIWDLRGHYIRGPVKKNLQPIKISDEYWFSWKNFHPMSELIRLKNNQNQDD
ncbi:MAG: DUF3179 domain-containing (seleno)protein [Fidelibacterota bacterium]